MRLVVSTDDPEIRDLALASGAEAPFLRPDELSADDSPTEAALLHVVEHLYGAETSKHIVILPPTSPVRSPKAIDGAISLYERSGAGSLVSVSEVSPLQWRFDGDVAAPLYDVMNRPMRQDIMTPDRRYIENGSICITSIDRLRTSHNRISGPVTLFLMEPFESIDIDTEFDWTLAERALQFQQAMKHVRHDRPSANQP